MPIVQGLRLQRNQWHFALSSGAHGPNERVALVVDKVMQSISAYCELGIYSRGRWIYILFASCPVITTGQDCREQPFLRALPCWSLSDFIFLKFDTLVPPLDCPFAMRLSSFRQYLKPPTRAFLSLLAFLCVQFQDPVQRSSIIQLSWSLPSSVSKGRRMWLPMCTVKNSGTKNLSSPTHSLWQMLP